LEAVIDGVPVFPTVYGLKNATARRSHIDGARIRGVDSQSPDVSTFWTVTGPEVRCYVVLGEGDAACRQQNTKKNVSGNGTQSLKSHSFPPVKRLPWFSGSTICATQPATLLAR
jgi:hypothetical protein